MPARVLVVDDIAANVRLLEAKLLVEYYEVITASNGPDALKLVKERLPDIILLDVMMPEMDGFEVCRRIKSDPASVHIPVIMVTALSETPDRVQGLKAGADDFLTKPVNDVALFARIRSLVRLKRASDEWRTREATILQFDVGHSEADPVGSQPAGNILFLDDGSGAGKVITEKLKSFGHSVTTADNGADLALLAAQNSYDLVLAIDGDNDEDMLRLCSRLRSEELTRKIPILVLFQEGDEQRPAKALEIGVNDYLMTPVDREELSARVAIQIRRKRYEDGLRKRYRKSLNAAVTDSLTGINNRRYIEAHFQAVDSMLAEAEKPISILMLDVDRFKAVNDEFGHGAGDEVLRAVAQRILGNLRSFDTAARYGGEEFIVLMPNTQLGAASAVAERLCESIGSDPFKVSHAVGEITVTISIGVTSDIAGNLSLEDFVRRADEALYEAKHSGRNRVVSAGSGAAGRGSRKEPATLR